MDNLISNLLLEDFTRRLRKLELIQRIESVSEETQEIYKRWNAKVLMKEVSNGHKATRT